MSSAADLQIDKGRHRSILEEFWNTFKKNRLSLVGGVLVLIFVVIALAAPVISPSNPVKQYNAPQGQRNPLPIMATSREGHLFLLGSDKLGRDIMSPAFLTEE
ncbi:MAG: hypothetical protein ABR512_04555 [Desulfopila sp.]